MRIAVTTPTGHIGKAVTNAIPRILCPPTLIVWGKHDPFFTAAGAEAYKRDLPEAELHLLNTGHFALETHGAEIAQRIRQFMQENVPPRPSVPLAQRIRRGLCLAAQPFVRTEPL